MNFLEYVNEKKRKENIYNSLNESFKDSDIDKVTKLITELFKKNITGNVYYGGSFNSVVGDTPCIAHQWTQVLNNKIKIKWLINYSKSGNSVEVYSIDFFTGKKIVDILEKPAGTTSDLTIFTMGSSVAYFLPIVYHVVNHKDFNLNEKTAKDLSKKIFVKSGDDSKDEVKESIYSVGALKYNIYENLSQRDINTVFNFKVNEGTLDDVDDEVLDKIGALKKEKSRRAAAVTAHPKDKEKRESYEEIKAEYKKVMDAIKGGATSLKEIEMSIKTGVSVKMEEATGVDEETEEDFNRINKAFSTMIFYLNGVLKARSRACFISRGAAGMGKTYHVEQFLKGMGYVKEERTSAGLWKMCTGVGRPRYLYQCLCEAKEKNDVILIDDCDSLLQDENCANMLKAALQNANTEPGRLVTYGVGGALKVRDDDTGDIINLPKKTYFKGSVIILTNLSMRDLGKEYGPVIDRAYVQDLNFKPKEILEHIKSILPKIGKNFDMKTKFKAYDYLYQLESKREPLDLSFRGFLLCCEIFDLCQYNPDCNDDIAREMIKEQMKIKASKNK